MNLPSCPDIERWILGYTLRKSECLDTARAVIETDDFSLEQNRKIWRRVCELYDVGKPVDNITVFSELRANGEDKACGGLSYLLSLDEGLPDSPHLDGYIERLRESTLRRRMIFAAQHLMNQAADTSEPVDQVLNGFSDTVTELSKNGTDDSRRPVSAHEIIRSVGIEGLVGHQKHRGVKLPWKKLDHDMNGIGPGQMVVLMAATSRGKTSMALQVATCAAQQGFTPLIWTMEMSVSSMLRRMINQLSGVYPGKKFLTADEREAQGLALAHLNDNPLYFDRHSHSVSSFIGSLRQVRAKNRLGVAIVDYLQLIRAGGAKSNRAQEVSDNSRALKLAAMDFEIPIWVLSQVDRSSVKGEGKIGLHSAKESGDIENDADVMLWIDGGELSRDTDTLVSLHVGKQREGPAGFGIPMLFHPQSQVFQEIEDDRE